MPKWALHFAFWLLIAVGAVISISQFGLVGGLLVLVALAVLSG